MNPTINAVTLAVDDLPRARKFYQDLDCALDQDQPRYVSFDLGESSSALSLYPRRALAHDAGVDAAGSGFTGVSFNYFVGSDGDVDDVLDRAEQAGGTIVRSAQKAQWGGYFGYFGDPDGYLWKVVAGS